MAGMRTLTDPIAEMALVLLAAPPPVTTRRQLASDIRVSQWSDGALDARLDQAVGLGLTVKQSDGTLLVNIERCRDLVR